MNERIKELMAEARTPFNKTGSYFTQELLMEKFAELIVKECADVGERYADGNYEVYNQILKRFGMEEE